MLATSTCLHIPPLYEEGTARLFWESVDDAQGYELDCSFDDDFHTALHGKTWANLDEIGRSWEELQQQALTWEAFAALPSQGLTWANLAFLDMAWEEMDAKAMSWQVFHDLAATCTIFRGPGEKTPGPDQGLTWANLASESRSWGQIEALDWT